MTALWALRTWLDSWSGIGRVAVGMAHQGYDLQLTRYDERAGARPATRRGHGRCRRLIFFTTRNHSADCRDYRATKMGKDDGAIVERVLAGDREAFGLLIDRHRDGATRFALRILRVRADAEDVVQEAWLHAFLDLGRLRTRDGFVAWLLGIVVNLAKSWLRARRETPSGARIMLRTTASRIRRMGTSVEEGWRGV